ncbi:MAG TPA: sugar phosphate isomerase/epimerase family protein [Abditibacterium sp.]|jgi:sugar phosphate isomerase/epimerase
MKFGICSAPGALGDPLKLSHTLAEAGADYLDWAIGAIMASEAEFEKLRGVVENGSLKAEAWMSFLPPHHRITGPNVELNSVLEYATLAMQRARALGGEVIVLGSGGARKVPEGFPLETARAQFIEFGRELGPRAAEIGISIAIEPLNRHEDNFITSVAQGADFVDAIAHPNIQLLADFYHMFEENEPISNVESAGERLKHTHVADLGREAPGFAKQGEADFVGFFRALRGAGYDGRCSFEGKCGDLARQAKPILDLMRERYAQSGI